MKIFFTFSRSGVGQFGETYLKVLQELREQKVHIDSVFGETYFRGINSVAELMKSESNFKNAPDTLVRKAIFRCEAIVVEASHSSFRLGFETFFSLSQQKPVLVLSRFHNHGTLIDQPQFFAAKYTDFTLPDEIEKFIKHVRFYKLRNRFNLFISDSQKIHLEKSAKMYGISMSDYIRNIIDQDIKKM